MTPRHLLLALVALTFAGVPCSAQNYCDLLNRPSAVGFRPPSGTAAEILKVLSEKAPFPYETVKLRDARDNAALRAQGAAAEFCNRTERWIFYDSDFVEQIRSRGQSDWPRYFVFAHEVAHLSAGDPNFHRPEQELQADWAAAHWLTLLNASVQDLVDSINAFVVNEQSQPYYPSRCERVANVIRAYNDQANTVNTMGANKPLYDVGNCAAVARGGGGLYVARTIDAGAVLQAADVRAYGTPAPGANLPLDYARDLAGMCTAARLTAGQLLTWSNVGVCALMTKN